MAVTRWLVSVLGVEAVKLLIRLVEIYTWMRVAHKHSAVIPPYCTGAGLCIWSLKDSTPAG